LTMPTEVDPRELVNRFLDEFYSGNFDRARGFVSDDYTFVLFFSAIATMISFTLVPV
jgi:hypothetical protein